jgi:hypothetical protein
MSNPKKPTWRERIGRLLGSSATRQTEHPQFSHFSSKGDIEKVFTSGGVQYYRFVNEANIPALRAMSAKDVYAELSFRTTSEHLKGTLLACRKLMDEGKYTQAAVLHDTLIQRLEYISHVDILYRLASVLYFDAFENVLDWDPVYNQRKVAAWQQNDDLDAFFLKTPIRALLPFADISKIDLASFTTAQRKADESHLATVLGVLSRTSENAELSTYLTSQMETLQSLTS